MSSIPDNWAKIADEVLAQRKLIVDRDDPAFLAVYLNELALAEAMGRVQVRLKEMLNQIDASQQSMVEAASQLSAATQKNAKEMINAAGSYAADQVESAVESSTDRFRSVLKADRIDALIARDRYKNMFWFLVGAATTGFLITFLLLWFWDKG